MKFAITVAVTIATLAGLPLLAQDSNTDPNAGPSTSDSAKVTYAPAAGGFGDLAASHAWEMSAVTGELEGKLDSKTAKVGDRVVLKTADKVQTSDGTVIPRGSRLVGRITEAQAYDQQHGPARIAIAFDHAELKSGQSISVFTLIRGVSPSGMAATARQDNEGNALGAPAPLGPLVNSGRMSPDYGGVAAADGDGMSTSPVDRTSDGAGGRGNRAGASRDSTPGSTDSTVQPGVDLSADTGAHGVAAARARPHPTNIRGVMLAGNSSSSGVLLAPLKDIQFDSGTQIELGVVANR